MTSLVAETIREKRNHTTTTPMAISSHSETGTVHSFHDLPSQPLSCLKILESSGSARSTELGVPANIPLAGLHGSVPPCPEASVPGSWARQRPAARRSPHPETADGKVGGLQSP